MKKLKIIGIVTVIIGFIVFVTGCDRNESTKETKKTLTDVSTVVESKVPTDPTKWNEQQKTSYAIAYTIGKNVVNNNEARSQQLVNVKSLNDGFVAFFNNEGSKFSQEQTETIYNEYTALLQRATIQLYKNDILFNKDMPTVGPDNAPVTIIEFFDYNCRFCHESVPIYENVMKSYDKNVRFIFNNLALFAPRSRDDKRGWPSSEYSAKLGRIIYKKFGAATYLAYYKAVFATGLDEGKLKISDVKKVILKTIGNKKFDIAENELNKNEDLYTKMLAENLTLGIYKLHLNATPMFIIIPTKNANWKNTTIIRGKPKDKNVFDQAIKKALTATD